ncbi:MAG TPA: Gfo/Idh/MocA family oxidoreductase [Pirellulaceae bacterium]|nr:Gfo/Idh/MocA family oxidoreductase [Pirellulaceae bacterium]HMO92468.1 Gfo/Idh/MocA family oxidoreductase [Pirellulaceae bacterium]HMP67862.1 Gfo/Idh/MocA family oxidoreductase [Pirellulaceae bacterium]
MKIRVGLIGLGDHWLSRHYPALKVLSDRFEVRAICCEIAHRAEKIAREFNAYAMDGFRAMIAREDIDAVLALATDWVGPLPILAACDSGKSIYSSSALDIAPDQVDLVRRRVDASGVAFMAELPRRFSPATIRLKELIATRLGRPQLLFCHERMSTEQQTDRLRRGIYCPLTMRHLMELIDWCSYLVDANPSSVLSGIHCPSNSKGKSFYQNVNLEFPSFGGHPSASAQISVGHYIPEKWPEALSYRRPPSLQVSCENGIAFVDLHTKVVWFDDAGQHTESLEEDRAVGEQLLTHFYRSITSLVRNRSDLDDAYRAMIVATKANQSADEKRRIYLEW